MKEAFDLAILGSGFGGSLLAMVGRRLGLSVLLLERGAHPRFAIGESTSPLANLLLEELAHRYDLPRLLPFATYGTWKRAYPEVAVGLKRGFSFYRHETGRPFAADPEHRDQLLVAASPNDAVADTHWYRADFDHFLVREAQSLGAEYVDRVALESLRREGETTILQGDRGGQPVSYRARLVVDATGPRGALSRLLELPEAPFPKLPPTQALFTHFTGVSRFSDFGFRISDFGFGNGDRPIVPNPQIRNPKSEIRNCDAPPYPPDDAALHHIFDGGWMWVLRFDNGVTSAGFAVEDWLAEELRLGEREAAWERFRGRFPSISEQFAEAQPILPFVHAPRLSYRCARFAGESDRVPPQAPSLRRGGCSTPGWVMLPSAAAFVDPLFSTGFPLTLLGIHRLGEALKESWGTAEFSTRLRDYAAKTSREAEAAGLLVGGCYACFSDLPAFAALSMLYFVAASFSEMARRLGWPDLASEFLLQNQPSFQRAFRRHCLAARRGSPSDLHRIGADMEPFNIAGLCDARKKQWYDVDLNDVVRGASKLGRTPAEVQAFFLEMGWQ